MKKIVSLAPSPFFFALSQFSEHLFPVVAEPVPVVEEVLPDKAFIYVTGAYIGPDSMPWPENRPSAKL